VPFVGKIALYRAYLPYFVGKIFVVFVVIV
jgi:hypothetical protein